MKKHFSSKDFEKNGGLVGAKVWNLKAAEWRNKIKIKINISILKYFPRMIYLSTHVQSLSYLLKPSAKKS